MGRGREGRGDKEEVREEEWDEGEGRGDKVEVEVETGRHGVRAWNSEQRRKQKERKSKPYTFTQICIW